jgi:hypothetical protein
MVIVMPFTNLSDIGKESVKIVDWSGHHVTFAEASALRDALKTNAFVEIINLSITALTDDKFNIIMDGILNSRIENRDAFKEINVSFNELTSAVIPTISKLVEQKKVNKFNFQYNDELNTPEIVRQLDLFKKAVGSQIILLSMLPKQTSAPIQTSQSGIFFSSGKGDANHLVVTSGAVDSNISLDEREEQTPPRSPNKKEDHHEEHKEHSPPKKSPTRG